MEVRKGYKQTDAGVIPQDWDVDTLESTTPINRPNGIVDGPFGSNLKTIHYRKSGIPIITSGYVTDGKFFASEYLYVDKEKFVQEKRSAVSPGDIVMAKIGARCGASAILPDNHEIGILSGNALKITVDNSRHSTYYIWQILWNLYSEGNIEALRTVGAQPAISMTNLKKFYIPLPPLAEQEAIAEALSDADTLIEAVEQLLTKKRQIKQGAMQELLTGKRRLPEFISNVGYKQTEIGVIPDDWKAEGLGAHVDIKSGESPSRFQFEGDGIPYFKVDQLNNNSKYLHDTPYHINSSKKITQGSLIFPKRGASILLNKVRILEEDAFMDTNLMTLTPKMSVHSEFLYYALTHIELWRIADTTSIPQINNKHINPLVIAFPPTLAEQTAIAEILSDMDAEISALEEKLVKARQVKAGMMSELLTGKVRLV